MGLFLAVAGIIGATEVEVVTALSDYAKAKNGVFRAEKGTTDDDEILVLYNANGNTSLLFPSDSLDWWDISEALSRTLKKVVLSLHIHDGDFWMYILYKNGVQIDAFNPIPDYWIEDISEQEREDNRGNAEVIAQCIPGVTPDSIKKYFVTWDLESDEPGKAYPEDEYSYGDDWQMLDFLKKLRVAYPTGSDGRPLGPTYRFKIPVPPSNRK